MKFRKPRKPKWLKKITDDAKSWLDSLEKSINEENGGWQPKKREKPLTMPPNITPKQHLNDLRDIVHKNAVDKGFYECDWCDEDGNVNDGACPFCDGTKKRHDKNFGELLMLITSELGEALEADRKNRKANRLRFEEVNKPYGIGTRTGNVCFEVNIKDTVEDEIADSLIRILDLCGYYNIDIDWHVEQKMKYNATREARHGKKY